MKEVWKDIEGYEGLYQVSNFGRIKSLTKNKFLKPKLRKGRCIAMLYKNFKYVDFPLNRLVAKTFIKKDLNEKDYVMRKDGNIMNCRSDNLFIVQKEKFVECTIFKNGYNQRLYFDYYGKKYTKKELLKIGNIAKSTFEDRIKRGWNVYETVEIPVAKIKGVNC